jgi:hypothetical protein
MEHQSIQSRRKIMKNNKLWTMVFALGLAALLMIGMKYPAASAGHAMQVATNSVAMPAGGGGDPGPVDNWFTYQGFLEDGGTPINDTCDFQFGLWDSSGTGVPPIGGTQVGTTEPVLGLAVTDGLFSYPLNATGAFGDDAFNGQRRYLAIAVRCPAGGGAYTPLAPRQLLTAAPYALSLRPGAIISSSQNSTLLRVVNSSDAGTLGSAISARGNSDTAPAIAAYHDGTGHALYGFSNSSYPTVGGVNQGNGSGVSGNSTNGFGVYGSSINDIGMVGVQSGYSTSDLLYWDPGGLFGGMNGVVGITKEDGGYGVLGHDQSSGGGWAGRFVSDNGSGVYITSPALGVGLTVSGGTKNAVVRTGDESRLMYSEEATEVWFSDYGFAQLETGFVRIDIDPLYAQTVTLTEPYHVFLQVYGDAELYVSNRQADGFEVHLRDGEADVEFSYRIVATRLGYEDARMERAPWADNDPHLFPELADDGTGEKQGGQ